MLQLLREKAHGYIAWLIVLLIAAAFAFFGLTNYFSFSSGSRSVAATINGEKILWPTVQKMYEQVARRYGEQADAKAIKEQILMKMVERSALMSEAKILGFRVGDEQIAGFISQIADFQVDGKFSKDQYLKALGQASYTDASFRKELSQDVLLGQFQQGIAQSSFILYTELQNTVALLDQKRDIGYMQIPANKYQKEISISADQIKAYYDDHQSNFVKP